MIDLAGFTILLKCLGFVTVMHMTSGRVDNWSQLTLIFYATR